MNKKLSELHGRVLDKDDDIAVVQLEESRDSDIKYLIADIYKKYKNNGIRITANFVDSALDAIEKDNGIQIDNRQKYRRWWSTKKKEGIKMSLIVVL
jgi:hypothetical protein